MFNLINTQAHTRTAGVCFIDFIFLGGVVKNRLRTTLLPPPSSPAPPSPSVGETDHWEITSSSCFFSFSIFLSIYIHIFLLRVEKTNKRRNKISFPTALETPSCDMSFFRTKKGVPQAACVHLEECAGDETPSRHYRRPGSLCSRLD